MGLALFLIGLILGFGCLGYFIYTLIKFTKSHTIGDVKAKIDDSFKKKLIYFLVAQGCLVVMSSVGLMLFMGYKLKVYESIMLVVGSFVFGASFNTLVGSFILYYYRPDLVEEQRKLIRKIMFIAIPIIVVSVILLTEGFAKYIDYSKGLPNGISFSEGLTYPDIDSDGFNIKFYGILIVSGALISYFVCDHYFYKEYKAHNIIDSLFVFAFVFGIIGARLWFCLVLEPKTYLADPVKILQMNKGGLAIQGGALLGIIAGVSFILLFRKYVDLRFAMDVAVPSILLAQVLGRWGNFFNQEVYGFVVSKEALFWVPTIVKENMFIGGEYRLPLFLIEGIINLCGYFIIRYLLGKVCKCKIGLGYQASFYIIWYGMVRAVLEPLREGFTLNVGSSDAFGYMQSWIVAFCFIGGGLLLFLAFFIIHKVRMNKNLEDKDGKKIKTV